MNRSLRTTLTGVGMSLVATLGVVVPLAAPAHAAVCPDNGWGQRTPYEYGGFSGSGVHIRTGPYTTCTSVGAGYPGQTARYHCTKNGWTHLTNTSTGKSGWSINTYLIGGGSSRHCSEFV